MEVLCNTNRPHRRNTSAYKYKPTDEEEMMKFTGLLLLAGQIRVLSIRCYFSQSLLYYIPVFSSIMSGRRFELFLRCFSCSRILFAEPEKPDRLNKVQPLFGMFLKKI